MDKRIDLTLNNSFKVTDSTDNRRDIGLVDRKLPDTSIMNILNVNIDTDTLPYQYYDEKGNYLCDRCGKAIIFNYNKSTLCDSCLSILEIQQKEVMKSLL